MASSRCSDLVLGLSSSDEDGQVEAVASDDVTGASDGCCSCEGGAEGFSTTPSSESSGSSPRSCSLDTCLGPRAPRVAKRCLRGELLERWPGWTSPARKRLRSSSPEPTTATTTATPARECDRFWRLVERIASSSPSLTDDRERLFRGVRDDEDDDGAARTASSPPSSTRRASTASRGSARTPLGASGASAQGSSDGIVGDAPSALRLQQGLGEVDEDAALRSALLALQSAVRAMPDEAFDDDILPPPSPFSGEPTRGRGNSAEDRVEDTLTPQPPDSAAAPGVSQQRDEYLYVRRPRPAFPKPRVFANVCVPRERLQLLSCRPLFEADSRVDAEEGSVLQLLVITPTEERKMAPEATAAVLGAAGSGRPPRRKWAAVALAAASACRAALRRLARLRFPYFVIVLGIVQVTLTATPTPYGAQELKNMFVWDCSRLFREPWRSVSYAMLHSGPMHVALNVCVQTVVGTTLEREQGALRVAGVYFGGAMYGAIVTGVVQPALLMLGGSAGIYSLLMSHLAHLWMNIGRVRYGKTRACAVLLMTGTDMAYAAHHAIKRGNAAPRIGVTAHCAGAVSGLFLGMALFRTVPHAVPLSMVPDGDADAATAACCCRVRVRVRSLHRAAGIASGIVLATTAVLCPVWVYVAQSTLQEDPV